MARLTEYIPQGLYSARQAAKLLNLSISTIRERMASGELERLPLGPRQIKISSRSMNRMIAERLRADGATKGNNWSSLAFKPAKRKISAVIRDDLKRLVELIHEVDRKRVEDKELLLKKIKSLITQDCRSPED